MKLKFLTAIILLVGLTARAAVYQNAYVTNNTAAADAHVLSIVSGPTNGVTATVATNIANNQIASQPLPGASVTGTLPLATMPAAVVTNDIVNVEARNYVLAAQINDKLTRSEVDQSITEMKLSGIWSLCQNLYGFQSRLGTNFNIVGKPFTFVGGVTNNVNGLLIGGQTTGSVSVASCSSYTVVVRYKETTADFLTMQLRGGPGPAIIIKDTNSLSVSAIISEPGGGGLYNYISCETNAGTMVNRSIWWQNCNGYWYAQPMPNQSITLALTSGGQSNSVWLNSVESMWTNSASLPLYSLLNTNPINQIVIGGDANTLGVKAASVEIDAIAVFTNVLTKAQIASAYRAISWLMPGRSQAVILGNSRAASGGNAANSLFCANDWPSIYYSQNPLNYFYNLAISGTTTRTYTNIDWGIETNLAPKYSLRATMGDTINDNYINNAQPSEIISNVITALTAPKQAGARISIVGTYDVAYSNINWAYSLQNWTNILIQDAYFATNSFADDFIDTTWITQGILTSNSPANYTHDGIHFGVATGGTNLAVNTQLSVQYGAGGKPKKSLYGFFPSEGDTTNAPFPGAVKQWDGTNWIWIAMTSGTTANTVQTNVTGTVSSALALTNVGNTFAGQFNGNPSGLNGSSSEAFGVGASANGNFSVAVGESTAANAALQTAIGYSAQTQIAGTKGTAIGASTTVTGDSGTALGYNATAGTSAVALGAGVTAANNTIVLGTGQPITGNGSGLTNLSISGINASGTPSSTTYLSGSGVWSTPAGGTGQPNAALTNSATAQIIQSQWLMTNANNFIVASNLLVLTNTAVPGSIYHSPDGSNVVASRSLLYSNNLFYATNPVAGLNFQGSNYFGRIFGDASSETNQHFIRTMTVSGGTVTYTGLADGNTNAAFTITGGAGSNVLGGAIGGSNGAAASWMLGMDGSGNMTTNPVPSGGGGGGSAYSVQKLTIVMFGASLSAGFNYQPLTSCALSSFLSTLQSDAPMGGTLIISNSTLRVSSTLPITNSISMLVASNTVVLPTLVITALGDGVHGELITNNPGANFTCAIQPGVFTNLFCFAMSNSLSLNPQNFKYTYTCDFYTSH